MIYLFFTVQNGDNSPCYKSIFLVFSKFKYSIFLNIQNSEYYVFFLQKSDAAVLKKMPMFHANIEFRKHTIFFARGML